MNVTLRKASAIQHSILEAIRSITFKTDVELNEFHNAEQEIARVVGEVKSNLGRRDALNTALYWLRRAVADANHANGVNRKLTEIAELEKQIQFYAEVGGKGVRESAEVLTGKLEKIRVAEPKSRVYGYNDTVTTSVFTAEDIAGFKKIVSDLKRVKQKIQDEVLELNVRSEITLDHNVVEVLKAESIL